MASGIIKEQQNVIDLAYTFVTMPANTDHVSITAVSKSGYSFWYWINVHSTGWVEGLFMEDPSSQTTNVWRDNGASSPSIGQGGAVYALAAYLKNS